MSHEKSLFQILTEEFIWLDSKYGHPPYHKLLIKEIFSPHLTKKDRIIEIGCGAGGLSRKLSQIVTEGEVVGLDIQERYIQRLNQSKKREESSVYKNLTFKLGSAEDIPYSDNFFDHAICSVSFSFWNKPQDGLEEIYRVLKLGGRLYIADAYEEGPFWATGTTRIFNLFMAYKINIYSSQEFREFYQRVGFTEVYQKEVMGTLVTIGTKGFK